LVESENEGVRGVDRKLKSKITANEILKQAGLPKAFEHCLEYLHRRAASATPVSTIA
jgi:hypothetical protein